MLKESSIPKLATISAQLRMASVIVVFLFLTSFSYGATYYFSSKGGSDEHSSTQARNPSTPWRSLDKLNLYFKYLSPGDSVLLKRGETFYGSITANRSGAVFAPIYFGAYGIGAKPQISGLTLVNTWKMLKKGVYESTSGAIGTNLVMNGLPQASGRYPNKGYLTFESHDLNNTIIDNELSSLIDWTGAEIVIRKTRWIIDKSIVTKQVQRRLTFADGNKYTPKNGYGYFFQKNINTLDQLGEWYYDPLKRSMVVYFGARSPESFNVQSSIVNYLVDIVKFNNIKFENLEFTGAGKSAFNLLQAKDISIKNCDITLSGTNAVTASYSPFLSIENCVINHSLSGGINLDGGCANASILNNLIKNTGLFAGMGNSGSGTYEAITSFGDNTNIEANRIDSTGYNGIYFGGNTSQAKNNYITYFCLTKDDGAGIYIGDWSKTSNKKVLGNIILNGVGNSEGTSQPSLLFAEGIYIDDNSESVTVADNTVSLCANNGIKIHNAEDISIYNNTVFNNGVQLRLEQDHYLATSKYIRNNTIRDNTFFSVNNGQAGAKFSTNQDDILLFGQMTSNIYCRPVDLPSVKKGDKSGKPGAAQSLQDDKIRFEFNTSGKIKTIFLSMPYVDVKNKPYLNKIDLDPYSSVILIAANVTNSDRRYIAYDAIIKKTFEK